MSEKETEKKLNSWKNATKNEKEKAKFLPKDRTITIYPDRPPIQEQVPGKYGKRLMYKVWSDIGYVYLTPVQMIEATARFEQQDPAYGTPITFP